MRILIVEDNAQEIERVKDLVGSDERVTEVSYASTLVEAVQLVDSVDVIITDVFYPLGKDAPFGFFEDLGNGLYWAEVTFLPMDISKHSAGQEIQMYLLGELARGRADEVPAGIVLGFLAVKTGKLPVFISSYEHHSARVDPLTWISRNGVFSERLFKEGLKEGFKRWEDALKVLDWSADRVAETIAGMQTALAAIQRGKYGEEIASLSRLYEHFID